MNNIKKVTISQSFSSALHIKKIYAISFAACLNHCPKLLCRAQTSPAVWWYSAQMSFNMCGLAWRF